MLKRILLLPVLVFCKLIKLDKNKRSNVKTVTAVDSIDRSMNGGFHCPGSCEFYNFNISERGMFYNSFGAYAIRIFTENETNSLSI